MRNKIKQILDKDIILANRSNDLILEDITKVIETALMSCSTCKHFEGCMIELAEDNLNPDTYFCVNFEKDKED